MLSMPKKLYSLTLCIVIVSCKNNSMYINDEQYVCVCCVLCVCVRACMCVDFLITHKVFFTDECNLLCIALHTAML